MVVPKKIFYECLKCKKDVWLSDTEIKTCSLCGEQKIVHKNCGGKVIERDFDMIKIR